MVESQKQGEIRKQIEYYLSDKNLERDSFFHDEISSNSEGYVELDKFLNCNKIKQLNTTVEEIVASLGSSTALELRADNKAVRRKGNPALPALIRKKQKTDDDVKEAVVAGGEQKKADEPKPIDPLIIALNLKKKDDESKTSWQTIRDHIRNKYTLEPLYLRFNKREGHVGLDKNVAPEDKVNELVANGLEIDGEQFEFSRIDGADLESFWKQHGNHYAGVIEAASRGDGDREKRRGKKNREQNWIELNHKKYEDVGKIKNIIKNLLAKSPDGAIIKEPDQSMLKELLKYHDNAEKKLENFKHFTVDVHPNYKETRCFFVVKEDGTKEDFSTLKCLKALEGKMGK